MSTNSILGYWIIKPVIAKRKSKCKESLCSPDFGQAYIQKGETCMEFSDAFGIGPYSRSFRVCLKCAKGVLEHHKAPYQQALEELELKLPKPEKTA